MTESVYVVGIFEEWTGESSVKLFRSAGPAMDYFADIVKDDHEALCDNLEEHEPVEHEDFVYTEYDTFVEYWLNGETFPDGTHRSISLFRQEVQE